MYLNDTFYAIADQTSTDAKVTKIDILFPVFYKLFSQHVGILETEIVSASNNQVI